MLSFNMLGRRGRLGNQMFQYAALFALARRMGTDYCIPRSDGANPWTDHQLSVFALPSLRFVGRQSNVPVVRATSYARDAAMHLTCPRNADLRGYFQCEGYFRDAADAVRREFTFSAQVSEHAAALVAQAGRPTISLHVRRADYLNYPDIFPICSPEYYAAALALFPSDFAVLVFSDDIAWCRTQPVFAGSRFTFVEGQPNHHDLCVMSHCSHHIIANSTFSWWGAWLGRNPDKTVVAPARWFEPVGMLARLNPAEIVPERWIKL